MARYQPSVSSLQAQSLSRAMIALSFLSGDSLNHEARIGIHHRGYLDLTARFMQPLALPHAWSPSFLSLAAFAMIWCHFRIMEAVRCDE